MRLVTLLLAGVVWIGCSDPRPELVFVSDRDGQMDIYVTDQDTSFFRRVTSTKETEYGPQWSPDGELIYFVLYDSTGSNVYSIRSDGTNVTPITSDTLRNGLQDVSPDGKRLLVSSRRDHAKGESYMVSLESGRWMRLTDNTFYEAGAKFSSDGRTITIAIEIEPSSEPHTAGNAEIFTMNPETLELIRITSTDTFDALPEFSPDGKQIAFHGCIDRICDIYVVDADGANLTNITNGEADSRWPRWSPDGKWLAYTRVWEENTDIWLMRPDGTEKHALIASPGRDEVAEWK